MTLEIPARGRIAACTAHSGAHIVRRRPRAAASPRRQDDLVQLRRNVIRCSGGIHDMVGFFPLSQFSP